MGSLHGYDIDCDLPLARLGGAPGTHGAISVADSDEAPLDLPGAELGALITDQRGRPRHARAIVGGRVLSWHHDAGSFLGDPESLEISYRREDRTDPDSPVRWEDRLASTAIPLLLGARGELPLHAAANLVGDRALLICGVTGRGKSTLSAALAAAGHPALGEDGVVVRTSYGVPMVSPGAPGALITDDVAAALGLGSPGEGRDGPPAVLQGDARGRRMWSLPRAETEAPVGAVVFLSERRGPGCELAPVAAAKCHRELLNHALSPHPPGAQLFAAAAALAGRVSAAMLRAADAVDGVPQAAERLAAFAEAGGSRSRV